jgi:hypothetical protein
MVNSPVDVFAKLRCTHYDEHQKMLFRDSLHAAFTLNEVKEIVENAGLERVKVYQSSELHWTAERKYSGGY